MSSGLRTRKMLYKDECKLRYRLADAALQHAILKKSNKSIYIAFTHLAQIEKLDIKLYKYEDLYYQYQLPFSWEAVDHCMDALEDLRTEIIS